MTWASSGSGVNPRTERREASASSSVIVVDALVGGSFIAPSVGVVAVGPAAHPGAATRTSAPTASAARLGASHPAANGRPALPPRMASRAGPTPSLDVFAVDRVLVIVDVSAPAVMLVLIWSCRSRPMHRTSGAALGASAVLTRLVDRASLAGVPENRPIAFARTVLLLSPVSVLTVRRVASS